MLKKILFSLLLVCGPLTSMAQHTPGSWRIIPMAGTTFEFMQDTPSKVYFLTGGSLYSYDKESDETTYYTPGQKISDNSINFIKYNGDKKYLLLAYKNGNIDLIYDSGKIVNLPEIKGANLTAAKTINNVKFGKDRIFVATSFGIVIYDDSDHHVVESGIYNTGIADVFEMGDYLVVLKGTASNTSEFLYAPKRDRHNTLDKFKSMDRVLNNRYVTPLSDTEYLTLVKNGNNEDLYYMAVNFNDSKVTAIENILSIPAGQGIKEYRDGIYVAGSDGFYILNGKEKPTKIPYPTTIGAQTLTFWNGPSTFWGGDASGVGSYELENGTPTAVVSKYFPESSKQTRTWYRVNTPDNSGVYFSECGRSDVFPNVTNGTQYFFDYTLQHEIYDWKTGVVAPHFLNEDSKIISGSTSRILYNPFNHEYLIVADIFKGIGSFKGNELYCPWFKTYNSPLTSTWGAQVFDIAFDRTGSLWCVVWVVGNPNSLEPETAYIVPCPIKILPKENVKLLIDDPEKLTEKTAAGYKHWLEPEWPLSDKIQPFGGEGVKLDAKFCFSSKANRALLVCGGGGSPLVGISYDGIDKPENIRMQYYKGFRDQDGNIKTGGYKCWMEEDKDGHIWIGTDTGVYILEDVDQLADGSSDYLEVVRPKVARNDGTNYADFLLSADHVLNIAVDANNRKWIATSTSGLYFVSEDGREILQEINMDNSPLVSNVVTMVACQPDGNDVLIGTPEGQYVYSSDSAPAKDDYSEIYAYPNPVRPEYTGWITINGLMDNSLIQITDSQNNIVWEGTSSGGMAVWDGCDTNGNRVRSGVYMVMASQNANGTSGAVTKIVVIN